MKLSILEMGRLNVSIVLFIVSGFLLSSCVAEIFGVSGKGNVVTENRDLSDFESIELQTSANVIILRDTVFQLTLEEYENIIDYTSTEVVNHVLVISTNPRSAIVKNSVAKIVVRMPDSLIAVVAAGAGSISVDSVFKDLRTLTTTSSGNIVLNKDVSLKQLTATVLGSGYISASGTDSLLTCYGMGTGKIDFANMIASNVDCQNKGEGDIVVHPTKKLNVVIMGGGNVYYLGTPIITKSVKGTGVVAPY